MLPQKVGEIERETTTGNNDCASEQKAKGNIGTEMKDRQSTAHTTRNQSNMSQKKKEQEHEMNTTTWEEYRDQQNQGVKMTRKSREN